MQKAISNKMQLGDTLNLLDDYAGVPFINDEGTLENWIEKVDKVCGFCLGIFLIFYQLAGNPILLANYLEMLIPALRI